MTKTIDQYPIGQKFEYHRSRSSYVVEFMQKGVYVVTISGALSAIPIRIETANQWLKDGTLKPIEQL